uniref:Protein tyrosine phosphatase receptor type O n=1 Tax=Leptobrachium leishanense TaxID=445787 RepID=A0A8C5PGA9_9ANUR
SSRPITWILYLDLSFDVSMFQVNVTGENRIVISLDGSDVASPMSVYVVKITGESRNYFFQFEEFNRTLPAPLIFNATYHGLYYIVTLMVISPNMPSKPTKSVTVLTKPLPVSNVFIHDYKPSPETGVLFEVHYPEKFNIFTRVNISYWEGRNFRSMLYKDFFKGKTVFNHWLPGTCYSNITFQLVSEASFNKSTLVEYSGVGHEPQQHRTVPFPPRNITIQIMLVNDSNVIPGGNSDEIFMRPDQMTSHSSGEISETPDINVSYWREYHATNNESTSLPYWWENGTISPDNEGFVNEIPSDFENTTIINPSIENISAPSQSSRFKVSISWLPPKAPTAFDGFNIHIQGDCNSTKEFAVDENTYEFVTELKEPGKYRLMIRSFSFSGSCDSRESNMAKALSFYISPDGTWFEELTEKPKRVSVKLLNSTAALVSWVSSQTSGNATIVSVMSETCSKAKESQRLEKHYCKEVNTTSNVIANLVPGAQYKVVVYLQKAPLIGPPSDAVTFAIEPTGVKDLVLYPVGPSAVVLSWTRPYHSVFRKYIVEMFYFNPVIMSSEWTPYYEIAATVSLTASVVTSLLPAWYYNFRVTMVTWAEPERRCCDTSAVSIITAPVAPKIISVDYINSLLYVAWMYGDNSLDLSHSRMLHWQVVAEGKKRIKKSVSRNMMTTVMDLPPGDIYNITVTAFTERSTNSSRPHVVKLDPAPPKSLFVVNKTQTSVTLLWVEEGILDYFEVFCWQTGSTQMENDPVTVFSHVVTISSLQPAHSYNCSVTTISHRIPSSPTYISVSTLGMFTLCLNKNNLDVCFYSTPQLCIESAGNMGKIDLKDEERHRGEREEVREDAPGVGEAC